MFGKREYFNFFLIFEVLAIFAKEISVTRFTCGFFFSCKAASGLELNGAFEGFAQ